MSAHQSFLILGEYTGLDLKTPDKNRHELVNCEFAFEQGVDEKGQPFTEVRGGTFSLIMSVMPPKAITEWALKSREYKDGVIVVADDHGVPVQKIIFTHAACTAMNFNYASTGKAYMSTTIVIQAEEMKFGTALDFLNDWVY